MFIYFVKHLKIFIPGDKYINRLDLSTQFKNILILEKRIVNKDASKKLNLIGKFFISEILPNLSRFNQRFELLTDFILNKIFFGKKCMLF